MKRKFAFKSLLSLAVAGTLFCGSAISAFAEDIGKDLEKKIITPDDMTITDIANKYGDNIKSKTIILSTSDNHGAILEFAYFAGIKKYFESLDANVILVDSGDFSSDKSSKDRITPASYKQEGHLKSDPARSIELMNAAGYDYACLGNHEFDVDYNKLKTMMETAKFKILDANMTSTEKNNYYANDKISITDKNNNTIKIGFFGLNTKESETLNMNKSYSGKLSIKDGNELIDCAKAQIKELTSNPDPVDIVVCLSHLGLEKKYSDNDPSKDGVAVRSLDIYNAAHGIDLMLDAHSHTTLKGIKGDNEIPIMATGIWSNTLGISVIDNSSKKIDRYLISDQKYESLFGTTAEERVSKLNEYGAGKVISLLEEYTGEDAETLFDYDYDDDDSSNDKNHDKNGKNGRNNGKNNGKNNDKNDKNNKKDRNSKSNSRFGKRSFEYDEEDFELEEDTQAIEDASTEATTADENAEITSEANDESSTQLDEQSTDAASTDDSTEATEQTDEQDNAEQSEDAEVDPAA